MAILLAGGLVLAYLMGEAERSARKCKGLHVEIADSTANRFVTVDEVRKYLDEGYKGYIGMPLDSIDVNSVEELVSGKSAVYKSEAYTTNDGILHIQVTQRTPVVRFQTGGGGFYADADGFLFPLQNSYSSRVQVVDGEIPLKADTGRLGKPSDPKEKEWLEGILKIVDFMEKSSVWKGKIVQITVGKGGNLVMIPREGKEKFHFGQPVEIEDKFKRMEMYYSHILPEKGPDTYTHISVEFDGQIVCK